MEMASTSIASSVTTTEEQNQRSQIVAVKEKEKECVHRTKTIQFLGRTTPVVLQNDNGPCPLLAICNVLLLRNNLNLSPDISEVSQEKLLSLVAERLIDSNCNINNKDAAYVENQQQNIADAIDLLPRLATGIDVNIKFRRIDDFEFTPECAIFDLLDIPLYHGWIVDPQDCDTAIAIGSKSYNAITGELVALETLAMEGKSGKNAEYAVDFAAATTATLGVPSPCLSKARSFDDLPRSVSDREILRKGDEGEEAVLLIALEFSESESPISAGHALVADVNGGVLAGASDKHTSSTDAISPNSVNMLKGHLGTDNDALSNDHDNHTSVETLPGDMPCSPSMTDLCNFLETVPGKATCSPLNTEQDGLLDLPTHIESSKCSAATDVTKSCNTKLPIQIEDIPSKSGELNLASTADDCMDISQGRELVGSQSTSMINILEQADTCGRHSPAEIAEISMSNSDSDSCSDGMQNVDAPEILTSSVDGSEPIYEGEEKIADSETAVYKDREPVYEGEVILAEQADKTVRSKDEITAEQGELIRNFLKNNASQLTFNGLFCLQDGLKERELCVFFRNNHFSTMFKYDGELYILATDQGYLNQPDLVWEKLNEVNGDTLFMTGNFKEFKLESHANDTWDEHNTMASTADYIANIDSAAQAGLNSDLQLAIALQQQEFEQQQPQQTNIQQHASGGSKLVSGPQVPKSNGKYSFSSSKTESKYKDKCTVM